MTEQLISKETAVLAKEKGFNEETYDYFNQNGEYSVIGGTNQRYVEHLISQSYQFADELLKQENL